ncbi:MAG: hypothetical protein CM1200mP6_05560 [Anaerolineaceae bacterium]|nr:MAG: hypothetical protein CM1200mP6_05560 [Anaerolineaceae bacterium]
MSNFSLLNHSAFKALSLCLMIIIGALMFPTVPVRANDTEPDPRFGIVESYQEPHFAGEWQVGWDRVVFEWYRVQPTGPNSWIPVYPHGLEIIEQYGDPIYRNSIEHSLLQNEWFDAGVNNTGRLLRC